MLPYFDCLIVISALQVWIVERELGVHVVSAIPCCMIADFDGHARMLLWLQVTLHQTLIGFLVLC
tara:strand:- start:143 stop:337 length:195 start_codon:yes stop_codon:yes gene_type:complete